MESTGTVRRVMDQVGAPAALHGRLLLGTGLDRQTLERITSRTAQCGRRVRSLLSVVDHFRART
ncbi:hypothetical protein [Spirillospora sp. NPDC047279]|uniref:hypothetical protein n=1 Tax=Spirillospora sp. NPDC047279 TaxID=3155478 RepID=UPI0033D3D217